MKQKNFDKWDLDFVVIGKTSNSNNLTLKFNNKIEEKFQLKHWLRKLLYMIENGLKKNLNK